MSAWQDLQKSYERKGLVLFFGAGVSKGLGLPSWDRLLSAVADRVHPNRSKSVDSLLSAGVSLPAIASLLKDSADALQRQLPNLAVPFVEIVREELYRRIHADFGLTTKRLSASKLQKFVEAVRSGNPTLAASAALCVTPARDRLGFLPNPRIHAVVNMNYDDLFTTFIRGRYRQSAADGYLIRVTERAAHSANPLQLISCFHPHGRLSFDPSAGSGQETPDELVLTEQSFFNFYNQPNALFNYTILFLLREYHALFLGMSFRDENVRRLLHYSACERIEHYRKEKRDKLKTPADVERYEEKARRKALRHFAVFQRSQYEPIAADWERSLELLGVRVLWVEDWDDLARQLGRVYGPDWEKVFADG